MSSEPQTPSVLMRFLDAFLQERNIKWVLTVGMLIMLGSSLLFVSTHWETYTPLWKHLFLLGYAAAIHGGGQWTYHRLGLRRTGTVLQGLVVVLIPVLFVALHLVPQTSAVEIVIHLLLLAATLAFSLGASWRIFTDFLRTPQPTFVVSYLTLSLAGAIVPGLPTAWAPAWAPAVAIVLWAVFAAGTVKVNRHVFWLTEEHRAPRIFGFLPIALLGGQFLGLFAVHAAPYVALPWMGFGCVLVAIPVLLTADTVARVFQQRTGDLVRPLPWSIVLPLGVGLALCAAGVVLAGLSLVPPTRPYALVVTAAAAAGLMGLVARRTGKQAFVWVMLVLVTLAYNFSPAFFAELARAVVTGGAQAVREERLPYAFYGLCHLPLLVGLMLAAVRAGRAGSRLFARPIRWYVFGLSCLLLAVSFTHPKALLPVGLVMVALFAVQARVLQIWYAVIPAIIAWIAAAYGLAPFATRVLDVLLPAEAWLWCLMFAAAVLLWLGRRIDLWVARQAPSSLSSVSGTLCQAAGLLLTLCLVGCWFAFWPLDVAGGVGLIGLVVFSTQRLPALRMPLLVLANWQVLGLVVRMFGPHVPILELTPADLLPICLPLAFVGAGSLLVWEVFSRSSRWQELALAHRLALRGLFVIAMLQTLHLEALGMGGILLAAAAFVLAVSAELISAVRNQREEQVWAAEVLALLGVAYLTYFRVVVFGRGTTMFVVLAIGFVLWLIKEWAARRPRLAVLVRPLGSTAFVMPLLTVGIGIYRHLATQPIWLGANSLALLLAAGFYFWRGLERGNKWLAILAGAILNVALILLWRELAWHDPQFFMIPIGISILALVQVLKQEIPERFHDPLRYLGALVILVSPTFHVVGGSWVHLLSLMVASVAIVFLAIGLRVRALLYTGTAFLLADLVAMLVRGSVDNPNILWAAGILLGAGVLTLGAFCERHRETLLERMRVLAYALKRWD